MRRAILISLGIVALVTGCGGGGSEPRASGEWTRHDIRDTNASIALPAEWKALEDFDEQTISDFTKENEKFAPYVEPLLRNDVFKLFALDPDIEDAFATNVNVIAAPVSLPLDNWVEQETASTRRVAVPGSVRSTFVRTPAGRVARVSWLLELRSGGGTKTLRTMQYMFRDEDTGYVVSFSTLPSLATKYAATFKKSAESFRTG